MSQENNSEMQEETKEEIQKPTDMQLLTKHLTKFLTYKYVLKNEQLEIKLNKEKWKKRFTDWPSIIMILTFKETPIPQQYFPDDPKQSITVILPKDGTNADLNFSFLKAAAYFPYQLDPKVYYDFAYDQDILIQLSFAAHYGYWNGRYQLSRLDLRFPLLKGHPMCAGDIPFNNLEDNYYMLSLPVEYHGKSKEGKRTLRFNPKIDGENLRKFFNYLVKIIQYGERPKGQEYSYENKEYIKSKNL